MSIVDYSSLIPYKIIGIINLIIERNNISFHDALSYLYISKLYDMLSDESTKFWHFSPHKLYDMLEDEKKNSFFELPDFV